MAPPMPHLDGVEHRHVRAGDLRMHYAEAGDPSADVVLLVHGWPENWWMWRDLIPPLAERFHVICPDLRGLGWTDAPPTGYDKAQLGRDVIALMDALEIDRARWVGHDWGAFSGFHAVTENPHRFERFMPMSVPHPWPPEGPPSPRRLLSAWYQIPLATPGLTQLAHGPIAFPRRMLQGGRAMGRFTDDELDFYMELLRRPGYREASTQYYRTFLTRELVPLARGAFHDRRLPVRTLMIVGTRDPVAGDTDESFRKYADDMELEKVDGVGHFLPEEAPELVRERALAFLP